MESNSGTKSPNEKWSDIDKPFLYGGEIFFIICLIAFFIFLELLSPISITDIGVYIFFGIVGVLFIIPILIFYSYYRMYGYKETFLFPKNRGEEFHKELLDFVTKNYQTIDNSSKKNFTFNYISKIRIIDNQRDESIFFKIYYLHPIHKFCLKVHLGPFSDKNDHLARDIQNRVLEFYSRYLENKKMPFDLTSKMEFKMARRQIDLEIFKIKKNIGLDKIETKGYKFLYFGIILILLAILFFSINIYMNFSLEIAGYIILFSIIIFLSGVVLFFMSLYYSIKVSNKLNE
jgi:hypothetical protein